ncbi:MAG: DUF4870 domain-containing protein [Micrococcales bacterium]|nr:DUF4870 domain-containing protein [Micrococcales bacterium]MCL2666751.1 DUF4870 domain-containing protein [Micrococcales bacterium]
MTQPPMGPESAPPPYGQPQMQPAGPPLSPSDQRLWAMLAHLGGIILYFLSGLIVWLVYKDRDQFVGDQAKEALNFQLTLLIGYLISIPLMFVAIGFVTYPLIAIVGLVFSIIGGLAANKGEAYRYPFALRLVK